MLFLGGQGAGELVIESGGGVANDGVWMALLVGSSAVATVSGVGSTWDVDGALRVGFADDAALRIEAGAAVTSDTAVIAATFDSRSEALVTGAGSVWEHGALEVGSAGTGSLTIAAGGVVTSGDATIGDRGTVVVDGADSRWNVGGSLAVETEAQAGALRIGIDGAAQHGVVTVVESAQLAGSLAVTLNGGFVPEPSDAFTVLTAGQGIAGAFENVASGERIDSTEGGGSFRVTYGTSSGAAEDQVVLDAFLAPEVDAALAGFVAALTALALRRRSA